MGHGEWTGRVLAGLRVGRAALWLGWVALVAPMLAQAGVRAPTVVAESVAQAVATRQAIDALLVLDDSQEQSIEATSSPVSTPLHRLSETQYAQRLAVRQALLDTLKSTVLAATLGADAAVVTPYSQLPMVHVRFSSPDTLSRLAGHAKVLRIDEVGEMRRALVQSLPLIRQPEAAAAGRLGAGTTVAVLDTGVNYTLPAFGSCTQPGGACKVAYAEDFPPSDGSLDDDGHGTNVAAIVLGVAPGARIAAMDVFGAAGTASDAHVIAAINRSLEIKATYNIAAINLSLRRGRFFSAQAPTDAYGLAIQAAVNAGITVVAASGNDANTDSMGIPAAYSNVVSVGAFYDGNNGSISWAVGCTDAVTAAFKVTCFSNSASFLTMLAPGAMITAAGITQAGTSQASPHVAGAAAVLRAAFPADTVGALINRLRLGPGLTDTRNGITRPRLDLMASLGASTMQFNFGSASYTVSEGSPSVTLPVTRSSSVGAATILFATSNGSAQAGSDYTASSGSLSFANGVSTANIVIPILADSVFEGNETFSVTIGSPSAGTVGPTGTATVTIVDDDEPVTVSFGSPLQAVGEGTSRIVIPVVRSSAAGTGRVSYATSDGTATAGRDYTAARGTVSFARGALTSSISIKITNDKVAEGNETFSVTLSDPEGMTLGGTPTTLVSIVDNDTFRLTVYRNGNGTVVSAPAGIDCPTAACNASFGVRSRVTLQATPSFGWQFSRWTGACSGTSPTCSVSMSAAQGAVAVFSAVAPGAALDNSALPWTTFGRSGWFTQNNSWMVGGSALQSGSGLADNMSSSVQTWVTGPGLLTYRWRVSSEGGYDFLSFNFNGWSQSAISGDSGWRQETWFVPAGSHVLTWTYAKDSSVTAGADAGWLDEVMFTPGSQVNSANAASALQAGRQPVQRSFGPVAPKP